MTASSKDPKDPKDPKNPKSDRWKDVPRTELPKAPPKLPPGPKPGSSKKGGLPAPDKVPALPEAERKKDACTWLL